MIQTLHRQVASLKASVHCIKLPIPKSPILYRRLILYDGKKQEATFIHHINMIAQRNSSLPGSWGQSSGSAPKVKSLAKGLTGASWWCWGLNL